MKDVNCRNVSSLHLPAEDTEDEVHDEERAEDDHRDEEGDRHVGVPHRVQDLHAVPAEREQLRGEDRKTGKMGEKGTILAT